MWIEYEARGMLWTEEVTDDSMAEEAILSMEKGEKERARQILSILFSQIERGERNVCTCREALISGMRNRLLPPKAKHAANPFPYIMSREYANSGSL